MSQRPTLNKTPFGGKAKTTGEAMLPSRKALDLLTKGNPSQRSVLSFAARTPIGFGAPNDKLIKKGAF